MYMPRPFREDDRHAAAAMARSAGFGHLVVPGSDGLASTPMPFLIDDAAEVVRGHLARANPIVDLLPAAALLIVPVSDAYVSPSWYPSKAEHGKVVPTWNYEVVHLRGDVRTHDDEWTGQLVRDLTDHHEAGTAAPWSVDDAPDGYIDGLRRAIVGISLDVTDVVAKRKLSQNRPMPDIRGVAEGLDARRERQDTAVARVVRRHAPEVREG